MYASVRFLCFDSAGKLQNVMGVNWKKAESLKNEKYALQLKKRRELCFWGALAKLLSCNNSMKNNGYVSML